jgi:hypothetical protein
MRMKTLAAGVALATLTPAAATAATCEQHRSGRIAATVGGGAGGALLGSAIAGRGDRGVGAVIGGVIGAIAGNQLAKGPENCAVALGYYDRDGNWRPSGVRPESARGYYDRNGDWVEGYPTGFYDNGQFVAVSASANDSYGGGYVDSNGNYLPAGVSGYYDRSNRWVAASSTGYWRDGRWVRGDARGYYDSRGRWIADTRSDRRGWAALEAEGYYDRDGRWMSGRTYGYYDREGRWVAVSRPGYQSAYDNRPDRDRGDWSMDGDADTRIARLRSYLDGRSSSRLTRTDRDYLNRELAAIEAQNTYFRRDGRLTVREEAQLDVRLDRLTRRFERLDNVAMR